MTPQQILIKALAGAKKRGRGLGCASVEDANGMRWSFCDHHASSSDMDMINETGEIRLLTDLAQPLQGVSYSCDESGADYVR